MAKGKMNELLGRIVSSNDPVMGGCPPTGGTPSNESHSSAKARINVLVPVNLDGKIRGLADKEGISLSEIVNEALRTFLVAYEKKYGNIPLKDPKISPKSNRIYNL